MPEEDFVHLHVHSDYSLLDGCCKTDKLCEKAASLGHRALALTDHGVLFGAAEFFKKAETHGIKPLLGCEIYLVYEETLGKTSEEKAKQRTYHMGLIARNFKGYQNLVKLVSQAHTQGFYRKPRTSLRELVMYKEGLIAFSGCMSAVIPRMLQEDDYEAARQACGKFVDIFGKDHFFIELMDHKIPLQGKIIPDLLRLASEFGLKTVATNDVHYVEHGDWEAHDSLLCIQTGSKIEDEKRLRYSTQEFYFKNAEEMGRLFHKYDPQALKNTLEVADMCELRLPFGENHYPIFQKEAGPKLASSSKEFERIIATYLAEKNTLLKREGQGAEKWDSQWQEKRRKNGEYLIELCKAGLKDRYGVDYEAVTQNVGAEKEYALGKKTFTAKAICERLHHEMAIIVGTGFVDYFLIVWDLIRWARENDIPVGPGRGSGTGCMVAYVLRVTDTEPLSFGLLFERMLNLERVSPPDFDIDFCMKRRDEVIQYAREKYGRDRVANIITFGTFGAKMILRDLARVNNLSFAEADRIAKMVPDALNISLEDAVEGSVELQKEIKANATFRKIIEQGKVIEGMVRNTGKHACGIIISDQELTDLIPVTLQEGSLTTQYPKNPSESLGLLKMDFLGLKTLTVIHHAQSYIRRALKSDDFSIEKISLEDAQTFELLKQAETVGVFQMESEGMRGLCRQMEVSSIEEITALIALYRPGPMQFINDYIQGKKDPDSIEVPHVLIEDIVKETYGILVYQEQVMEVARRVAGYTLGEADILRRAMGKKIKEEMDAQKSVFIQGAKKTHQMNERTAASIFAILEKFAQYGFNKSHSAAYAILSYRTAWLKARHPTEFVAALLSSELGNADKLARFIAEAKRMGLEVLGPDVNESRENFTPLTNRKCIRFGLAAIKGVGDVAAKNILKQREEGGPYQNFHDFACRLDSKACNKRVAECLIKAGAFDVFSVGRQELLNGVDRLLKEAQSLQKDRESGQEQLFDIADTLKKSEGEGSREERVMDEKEKLEYERELLGFYLSGHPMKGQEALKEALSILPKLEALQERGRLSFRLCGAVNTLAKKITKQSKRPWAIFKLSNPEGSKDVVIYSEAYETFKYHLKEGEIVCVEGKARWDHSRAQARLEVLKIMDLEGAEASNLIERVQLSLPEQALEQVVRPLSEILQKERGGATTVLLKVAVQGGRYVLVRTAHSLKCRITAALLSSFESIQGLTAVNLKARSINGRSRRGS